MSSRGAVQAALALVAVRVILPALFSRDFSCAPFSAAALFNNLELVNSCWLLLLFFQDSTGIFMIFIEI